MFKFFKKRQPTEYKVKWKFIGDSEIYEGVYFSASLATLDADPCTEIISVKIVK